MSTPQIRLLLRFRDVDAFGHVYHAEYLTLLDEARTRWFREAIAFDEPGAYVVARVESADVAVLERWGERVLSAKTLAEVLDEPS